MTELVEKHHNRQNEKEWKEIAQKAATHGKHTRYDF
jgi:hypothetical protein